MLGIYEDKKLIKSFKSEEKADIFVPRILKVLLSEFEFSSLIYANGPGSFMGIKISFVCLKTLSLVKNIPLFAVSGFELNGFKPISANKNLCFVLKEGGILLEKNTPGAFFLPQNLQELNLKNDNIPFYFLDAVIG